MEREDLRGKIKPATSKNTYDFESYPSLRYKLPRNSFILRILKGTKGVNESKELGQLDIREIKDKEGKVKYHTLQIGEYAQTKVDEDLSKTLEKLYNGGEVKEDIICTGRWYSENKIYGGKHNPEFEYKGNRYVRTVSDLNKMEKYLNSDEIKRVRQIEWLKVEPISFKIKNWDAMPKNINPMGNGRAKYIDLEAEKAIYYGRQGENYTEECNFLNEAFNLSRQPMIEYSIPDSEKKIPEDAFNGCITLKKLVIHSEIKTIGKNAFDGLNFKYAYITKKGELELAQELPQYEYKDMVELDKLVEFIKGFDYSVLISRNNLDELIKISEVLSKDKFSMPYAYAQAIIENKNTKSFCEDSDFRFLKNEIPNINDILTNFSEEEQINFLKFANGLGCFSTEKILDKRGKETDVILAKKASSLLAQLLKADEIKLRRIS